MTFAKQFPSTIEVPAVQPTQLPNLPGNGGITVTNQDPQFSADVSAWQTFPAGQTQTLAPHQSAIFAEGSPVWARVTPGQAGSPASIELGIWPGSPSAPQGAVDVANEVTVNGTVDVGTVTGTVDANITNASIPVSGTVDASITNASIPVTGTVDASITNATLDVTGSTVSIAAGQVVEVENPSGGSLTVAGSVDIGTVTGTVTIDANGSSVAVAGLPAPVLLGTIAAGDSTVTITPGPAVQSVIGATKVTTGFWPGFFLEGATSLINVPSTPLGTQSSLVMLPIGQDTSYTVSLYATLPNTVYIWGVAAQAGVGVVNLPLTGIVGGINSQALTSALLTLDEWDNVHSVASGTSSLTFTPQGYTQELVIISDQPVSSVAGAGAPMPMRCLSTNPFVFWVPWVAEFGCTVTLAAAAGATWYVAELQAGGYRAAGLSPVTYTVDLANPAVGAQWSYTLPIQSRFLAVRATFFCDSVVSNRYPYLAIAPTAIFCDALPSGSPMTASQVTNLSWRPGAAAVPYFMPGFNGWAATCPDLGVLPAGAVLSSGVAGGDVGDYWQGVILTFAPG